MIDEKNLKEDVKKYFAKLKDHNVHELVELFFEDIIDIIDEQPKLSLENKTSDKWIPYDDEHEKPNEVGWYRVTEFSFLITRIINFRFWNGYRFEGCEEIIAWQPNPEPYKGLLQEKEK